MYWIQSLRSQFSRVNHAAVAVGGIIYSFGGYCSKEELSPYMDVFAFNIDSFTWRRLPCKPESSSFPPNLFGHSAVCYENKVYIWGGCKNTDNLPSFVLHCFDTSSWEWSSIQTKGHVPVSTDGHAACVVDGFMYVFGGYHSASEQLMNVMCKLNLQTFEWERIQSKGNPPSPRDFHTASVIDHRIYIFGGRSFTDDNSSHYVPVHCNDIMYFDTILSQWEKPNICCEVPRERRSHSAVVYDREIYIFGGCRPSEVIITELHLNDVHKFNPETNLWQEVIVRGDAPSPRRRHCSVVIGDQLYLFGGSSPDNIGRCQGDSLFNSHLKEEDDLFIMDFKITLKRLCQLKVIEIGFENCFIPTSLKHELQQLKKNLSLVQ